MIVSSSLSTLAPRPTLPDTNRKRGRVDTGFSVETELGVVSKKLQIDILKRIEDAASSALSALPPTSNSPLTPFAFSPMTPSHFQPINPMPPLSPQETRSDSSPTWGSSSASPNSPLLTHSSESESTVLRDDLVIDPALRLNSSLSPSLPFCTSPFKPSSLSLLSSCFTTPLYKYNSSFDNLKEFAEEMQRMGGLAFEERILELKKMVVPMQQKNGEPYGRGFRIAIRPPKSDSEGVFLNFILRKGPYESEIISENSFSIKELEYIYLDGYALTGAHNIDPQVDVNLKIRLSPTNGEIVNVASSLDMTGKEVEEVINALKPMFRGIKYMYLYDDAKKEFPELASKTKEGEGKERAEYSRPPKIWIKALAICDSAFKTMYQRDLDVQPAEGRWVLSKRDHGVEEILQDSRAYNSALQALAQMKLKDIYQFYKNYKTTGKIQQAIKRVFSEKKAFSPLDFDVSEKTLKELFSLAILRSRGKFVNANGVAMKPEELLIAKKDLVFLHDNFLVPWDPIGGTKSSKAETAYLSNLDRLVNTRVFLFNATQ